MQTLDPIASQYPEIDFYVVAFNESAAEVQQYIEEKGYTDLIAAQPEGTMLADLEITRQMAMVALNSEAVIYHRQLMGSADQWAPHFAHLTEQPDAIPSTEAVEKQKERRLMDLQLPA